MKNNIIELTNIQRTSVSHHISTYDRCRKICDLIARFADAAATLSIGVCTLFCMYLAYTML